MHCLLQLTSYPASLRCTRVSSPSTRSSPSRMGLIRTTGLVSDQDECVVTIQLICITTIALLSNEVLRGRLGIDCVSDQRRAVGLGGLVMLGSAKRRPIMGKEMYGF